MASIRNSPSDLYQRDYFAWLQDQVRALRERRIEDVDWENVAEEIEDLGKSEKRAVESQMLRLLEHLLKLRYTRAAQRRTNARGWEITVKDARIAIADLLDESPSLRPQLAEMIGRAFRRSRLTALANAKLPDDKIPHICPWTIDQLMDDSFFPGTG